MTGQFLPGKLADHRPALTACVATYYALCVVSFLFGRFVTQEYFLTLLASPEKGLPKLRLMFKMKRLDDKFSLVIAGKDEYAPAQCSKTFRLVHTESLQPILLTRNGNTT